MSLWVIVPVKPLRRAKSRLSGVLSDEERESINYSMMKNTLNTLSSLQESVQILVVSRDNSVLALAREYRAKTIQEDGTSHLNVALQRATLFARACKASQVMVVAADLPLLCVEDVERFIQKGSEPPVLVIAPDRRNEGTNALLMNPLGLIEYRFGIGSFQAHVSQANQIGARVEVSRLSSMELDLDRPDDLEILKSIEASRQNEN